MSENIVSDKVLFTFMQKNKPVESQPPGRRASTLRVPHHKKPTLEEVLKRKNEERPSGGTRKTLRNSA